MISLKEFRSQLPAEEIIVKNSTITPFTTAMIANNVPYSGQSQSSNLASDQYQFFSGGYKQFNGNKNKGKRRFNQGVRFYPSKQSTKTHVIHTPNPGIIGQPPVQYFGPLSAPLLFTCQICKAGGHTIPFCHSKPPDRVNRQICGKHNHSTWYYFYNDKGPNFGGSTRQFYPSQVYSSTFGASSYTAPFQKSSM